MRLAVNVGCKIHPAGYENPRIHDAQIMCHARTEAHVRDDIAFDIEPRPDLDQLDSIGTHLKYRALRHEQRELTCRTPDLGAVANLLQLGHELLVSALLADQSLALLPSNVEVAGSQRASEHHALRILADVD